MKQFNCKNCGAPVEHSYNHRCTYCGTLFDFNEENYEEVSADDMFDLKLEKIYYGNPDGIELIFTGYISEKPKIFEYDGKHKWITKTYEYRPPKKGFIGIMIFNDVINEYGLSTDFICSYIRRFGISEYQNKNLRESIILKLGR